MTKPVAGYLNGVIVFLVRTYDLATPANELLQ